MAAPKARGDTSNFIAAGCSYRQQVEANIVKGLHRRPVHAVRQLRGHGMHVLEHCSQQDGPPSRFEERKLRSKASFRRTPTSAL